MAANPLQNTDPVHTRYVCSACVGEMFLRRQIKRSGASQVCHYCKTEEKCWQLAQLSDCVEKAFEQHFERTPENPEGIEDAMSRDAESRYEWHRSGQESCYAIADAASLSEEIAEDIRDFLCDRHYSRDAAEAGEEQEFDPTACYGEKEITDTRYQESWIAFEKCLREESRYFALDVRETLDRVFAGVSEHKTKSRAVIVFAGPTEKLDHLFRARVFHSEAALIAAIERPDLHIGPPPPHLARPGRMNAAGISVFYGARSLKVALAEVRPPVGSKAVVGKFSVARRLRLLDLGALKRVNVKGSVFDPAYADRLERVAFLGTLCDRLSQAVMPDDEAAGYLVTQVVADYLANVSHLDGIIFPSVQSGADAATTGEGWPSPSVQMSPSGFHQRSPAHPFRRQSVPRPVVVRR